MRIVRLGSVSGISPSGSLANSFTSSAMGTSGQCFLKTLRLHGSISQKNRAAKSSPFKTKSKPTDSTA